MREENYIENVEVKNITESLWRLISSLSSVLSVEQYHVILFLLSAYYEGIIGKELIEGEVDYEGFYYALEDDHRYCDLLKIYKPIIDGIPEWPLEVIIRKFSIIDSDISESVFNRVFDNLLFKIASNQGKYSGEFLLPNEITSLMMGIIDIPKGAKVFNPFAGLASFATHLNNVESYYGQEINSTWVLGKLNLLRLDKSRAASIEYRVENPIENWPETIDFDIIVSKPPFNKWRDVKIPSKLGAYTLNNSYAYTIDKSISSISENGQVVIVVPEGFLLTQNSNDIAQKTYLVEKNLLDSIISLPAGIIHNTGVKTSIIILKNSRPTNDPIKMFDLSDIYLTEAKNRVLDVKRSLEIINAKEEKFSVAVSINQIKQENYDFSVGRFMVAQNNGTPLAEFFEIANGTLSPEMDKYPIIKVRDIISSSPYLDVSIVKEISSKRRPKFLSGQYLFINTAGSLLHSAISKDSQIIFFQSDQIVVLKLKDENKINLEYIHYILKSEEIKNQIKMLTGGSTQPMRMRNEDILSLRISLPTLEEQNKYVINQMMTLIRKEEVSLNKLKTDAGIEIADDISYLRHSLAGSVKNTRDSFSKVVAILNEQIFNIYPDLQLLTKTPRSKITLGEHLNIISKDLEEIKNTLNRTSVEIDVRTMSMTPIDFIDFIEKYTQVLSANRNHEFRTMFKYDRSLIENNNIDSIYILGNREMLRTALENIVENAVKHAFHDEPNPLIEFDLMFDFESDNMLQLDISNNGKVIPENFSIDDLTRKGQRVGQYGGDGFGGYLIKVIIEAHKGYVDITDESGSEGIDYPRISTSFEIKLPFTTNPDEYV